MDESAMEYVIGIAVPAFLGTMIALFGRWMLRRFFNFAQRPAGYRVRLLGIVLLGYTPLLLFLAFSPSLSERRDAVERVTRVEAADVMEIEIRPDPRSTIYSSLVSATVTVRTPKDIKLMVDALRDAHGISPNHPGCRWRSCLHLTTKSGAIDFLVQQTGDPDNGTLIYLYSNVTDGWILGNLRSDALGPLLETLAHP